MSGKYKIPTVDEMWDDLDMTAVVIREYTQAINNGDVTSELTAELNRACVKSAMGLTLYRNAGGTLEFIPPEPGTTEPLTRGKT